MKKLTMIEHVKSSLAQLVVRDKYLVQNDVNERSITHRLGIYLQKEFEDWDVDCEYNRLGECNVDGECLQKKLDLTTDTITTTIDTDARTVFPDIIIHRRGRTEREANLLVIEMKKENKSAYFDEQKLTGYVSQLYYQYGLLIIISVQKIVLRLTTDGTTWESKEILVDSLAN